METLVDSVIIIYLRIKGGTFGRNHSNLSCVQVREVKEELRSMRLEAHTKQLAKELKSARAALEQERKLRKVQSDTIKVKVSRCNFAILGECHFRSVDKYP